jgi:carbon monoxide dehydrogenase subunit G
MILENEFTVGADVETVWRALLDMEGVASCLPGATITATEQENVYDGSMRLKIGPMRVEYRGTATLSAVDEGTHTAVISLSAREAKGQGSAMATIRNRLSEVDGGTRVSAQTELHITGPQAQFGRGVIEDVGRRVLDEFSQRLEQRIVGGDGPGVGGDGPGAGGGGPGAGGEAGAGGASGAGERTVSPSGTPATGSSEPASLRSSGTGGPLAPAPPPVADELDVGSLVASTPAVRIGGAALLLVVLLILLRRRR